MIKLYKVGGSVRDKLLDRKCSDIDYAVEAESFKDMREYILSKNYRIFLEKPEFFTIRARIPNGKDVIDFTLCRQESDYSDHRHPNNVELGTIENDLSRRDFTMNAIAQRIDGNFIDPFNGISDIDNKIIRCVGNPFNRLSEDPLRILRALRFSVILGFSFDSLLHNTLLDDNVTCLLEHISSDRKVQELNKMFKHNTVKSIELLNQYPNVMKNTFVNGLWINATLKKN